jgi:hypothetical protein
MSWRYELLESMYLEKIHNLNKDDVRDIKLKNEYEEEIKETFHKIKKLEEYNEKLNNAIQNLIERIRENTETGKFLQEQLNKAKFDFGPEGEKKSNSISDFKNSK